jgi:transcriptional regulator with XRE-family HTH domain
VDTSHARESFRGLLLRHRGRSGLIQRDLAALAGISLRSVQDWEAGVNFPAPARLQALIQVFLEAGGFAPGQAAEPRTLWRAAQREAPRMHTPFDEEWFPATPRADTASGWALSRAASGGRDNSYASAREARASEPPAKTEALPTNEASYENAPEHNLRPEDRPGTSRGAGNRMKGGWYAATE